MAKFLWLNWSGGGNLPPSLSGFASDQPVNAASIQTWGVGRAVPKDATADMIRLAVQGVLGSPSYAAAAREFAQQLAGVDGAINAADEVGALMANGGTRRQAA
jgi:UDP:flavonoid glycosyltransferase YjiC (YdhE family)